MTLRLIYLHVSLDKPPTMDCLRDKQRLDSDGLSPVENAQLWRRLFPLDRRREDYLFQI